MSAEPITDRQILDDLIEAAKSASETMTAPLFWNGNLDPVYLGFESEAEAEKFEANIERMIARLEALFDQHGQI